MPNNPSLSKIAIIWDVDGTLVDTAELHFDAWKRLAERRAGRSLAKTSRRLSAVAIQRLSACSSASIIRAEEVAAIGERKRSYYRAEAMKGVELLPGVRHLLQGFAERGIRQAIGWRSAGNLEFDSRSDR